MGAEESASEGEAVRSTGVASGRLRRKPDHRPAVNGKRSVGLCAVAIMITQTGNDAAFGANGSWSPAGTQPDQSAPNVMVNPCVGQKEGANRIPYADTEPPWTERSCFGERN